MPLIRRRPLARPLLRPRPAAPVRRRTRRRTLRRGMLAATLAVGALLAAVPLATTRADALPVRPERPATATTTTASAPEASGCGGAAYAPGNSTRTISSGGRSRQFVLTIPAGYSPSTRRPLVFDFHGLGSDGPKEVVYSELATTAAARGYVGITPSAVRGTWAAPPLPRDLTFVDDLTSWAKSHLCIDADRVFAGGISNGALLAGGLGCERSGRFAALALVAGPSLYPNCADEPPLPVIGFAGTADPVVPYEGGEALGFPVPPVEDATAAIATARNHCAAGPAVKQISDEVDRLTWSSCANGAKVQLYRIAGGGHTWPGSPIEIPGLGPTTQDVDASALAVVFFDRHPVG